VGAYNQLSAGCQRAPGAVKQCAAQRARILQQSARCWPGLWLDPIADLGGSMPLPAAPAISHYNHLCLPMTLPLPPVPLAGLSAEPHVSGVVRLTEEQGGILLIASDGLWDVAEADAVVQAICQADRWASGQDVSDCGSWRRGGQKQGSNEWVAAASSSGRPSVPLLTPA
jgi:hypothetical protein